MIGIIVVVVIIAIFILINLPSDTTSDNAVVELTGETKEFEIVATNWKFTP